MNTISERYPEKCLPLEKIFKKITGVIIFLSVQPAANPNTLSMNLSALLMKTRRPWLILKFFTSGRLASRPYAEEKFKSNFRLNTFFIGDNTRDAVNQGLADYTPVFLSQVPAFFTRDWNAWILR